MPMPNTPTTLEAVFVEIYDKDLWNGLPGSIPEYTAPIWKNVEEVVNSLGVRSLADIGCGQAKWLPSVHLPKVDYIGLDIAPNAITQLDSKVFSHWNDAGFGVMDVTQEIPPKVDLVLLRHVLQHLSTKNVAGMLRNIMLSESKYLLVTSFTAQRLEAYADIADGEFLPYNVSNFLHGTPLFAIPEPNVILTDEMLVLYDLEDVTLA